MRVMRWQLCSSEVGQNFGEQQVKHWDQLERLCETQLGNGGARRSPAYIRNDNQLQRRQLVEFDGVFFKFSGSAGRAEVVLLTGNFPVRLTAVS